MAFLGCYQEVLPTYGAGLSASVKARTVLQERFPFQVVLIYAKLTFKSTIIGSMRPHFKAKTIF